MTLTLTLILTLTLTSVLTTDLLESLLENLPPETEARALRALQLEPAVLEPPERFCWEMAKMPRLRNMLQARRGACAVHARYARCMRGPCAVHARCMRSAWTVVHARCTSGEHACSKGK